MTVKNIKALAFEGGGMKGHAYAGALLELERMLPDGLRSITKVAGTSAGAIMALAIALGANGREIESMALNTEWKEFGRDKWGVIRDTIGLIRNHGVHRLEYPRKWLIGKLNDYGFQAHATFRNLRNWNQVTLEVMAYDEDNGELVTLGPDTTPDAPVVDSVLASMAIPGYFVPAYVDGRQMSDAGGMANHPIDLLEDFDPAQVLGLRVDSDKEIAKAGRPKNFIARMVSYAQAISRHASESHVPAKFLERIIRIRTGKVKATDFKLSKAEIRQLIEAGREAMFQFAMKNAKPSLTVGV